LPDVTRKQPGAQVALSVKFSNVSNIDLQWHNPEEHRGRASLRHLPVTESQALPPNLGSRI
jgi:hypothetical protein